VRILNRLLHRALRPSWEYAPGDTIWKLKLADDHIIVGESRNIESRTMSLFSIDSATGTPVLSNRSFDEPWWIALEMTIGSIAILHSYPRPDLPTALGAIAIDVRTGESLWSNQSVRVICGAHEIALVQRGGSVETPEYELVDLRTGVTLESEVSLERAIEFQNACSTVDLWTDWVGPDVIDEHDDSTRELRRVVDDSIPDRRGPIEALTIGTTTIAAVHARSRASSQSMLNNNVDAHLLVVEDNRIQSRLVMSTSAPAPSADSFFVWGDMLLFVRDTATLVGIHLDSN
jgi:hypothetical protein